MFTHPRFLPPAQILSSKIDNSLISEGSVLRQVNVASSIIGLRAVVQRKVSIKRSVMMGADFFDSVIVETNE